MVMMMMMTMTMMHINELFYIFLYYCKDAVYVAVELSTMGNPAFYTEHIAGVRLREIPI